MDKKILILDELIKKRRKKIDLYNEYTHIRGYHGCRPISIENYYKHGIKPISKSFAKVEAIARLCDKWITEDRVDTLFEKAWKDLQYPRNLKQPLILIISFLWQKISLIVIFLWTNLMRKWSAI